MAEVTVTEVAVAGITVMEPLVTELLAVGEEGVMIEERTPAVPVVSPVAPTPPKSAEEADTKSNAKGKADAVPKNAGYGIPTGVSNYRCTVHQPRIIGRDVNHLRVGGFDDDRVTLRRYLLLFTATQMTGLLGLAAQRLDSIGHIVGLVGIRLAKGRSPGEVLVHVFENRRELRHGLYTGIPVLFVDFLGQVVALEFGMPLHPTVCFDDLSWIGGSGQN